MIRLIDSGNWEGRASTTWRGPIHNLRKKIPTFTSLEFHIGEAVNVYKSLIVREPLGEVDLGDVGGPMVGEGMPNPMNNQRMPINVVSTDYRRSLYRGHRQGYKLVQHHYILDEVFEALKNFKSDSADTIKIESLDATLKISVYGARIKIQFLVPHYKKGPYTLKVTCLNSVDKSIALTIDLSLHQQVHEHDLFAAGYRATERRSSDTSYQSDILFAGFHHVHTQDLEDSAIRNFLERELHRYLYGTWETDPIPDTEDPGFSNLIDNTLNPDEREKFWYWFRREKDPTLLRFRELLAALAREAENLRFADRQRVRFIKLLDELHKLADQKEKEAR